MSRNKLFMVGVILLLSLDFVLSQSWLKQNSPTNVWLNRISFSDSLNGWAAGENGIIIHTSNGGINWMMQNSPVNYFIYDIFFLNNRLGWAVANDNLLNGTAILSTTTGGLNWSYYRYPDTTFLLYTIYFNDSLTGFMGGYGGKLLITSNSGFNWQFCITDSTPFSYSTVQKIKFFNPSFGVAVGGAFDFSGVIWKTTNGGLRWNVNDYSSEPVFDVFFLNENNIIAVGGDYDFGATIFKSSNSGSNWTFDWLNLFGIANSISFRTQTEGWAGLSSSPYFAYTTDGGNTWETMLVPDTNSVYGITFKDPFHGYACGTHGSIYKFNTQAIGIKNNKNSYPQKFSLYQNYPNPFNPVTRIKFEIPKIGNKDIMQSKLVVYDYLGREVITLNNGRLQAGIYEVIWDASDYPSGVYFYTLSVGEFTKTRKMIVLK